MATPHQTSPVLDDDRRSWRSRGWLPGSAALALVLTATTISAADEAPAQVLDCREPLPDQPEPVSTPLPAPPDVLLGDLFTAVQNAQLFEDQKVFVDAVPLFDPEQIVQDFAAQSTTAGFDLAAFVDARFMLPVDQSVTPPENQSLRDHINWLWPALTRTTTSVPAWSSLIPLPEPYVVPGGRFREICTSRCWASRRPTKTSS